jgi:hypothetical protein
VLGVGWELAYIEDKMIDVGIAVGWIPNELSSLWDGLTHQEDPSTFSLIIDCVIDCYPCEGSVDRNVQIEETASWWFSSN